MEHCDMNLNDLKTEVGNSYQEIRRDLPNAPTVKLKDWNGLSPYAGGPTSTAHIEYELQGNKVKVTKTGDGEHWYILS
jgi:hypothetical protein